MNVSLCGFNFNAATFSASSVKKGAVVALSGNLTVAEAAEDAAFFGVCIDCRDGYATVQLSGYCRVAYSATAPSVGYVTLAADGKGGVKKADSGVTLLVTDVDTASGTVGVIL